VRPQLKKEKFIDTLQFNIHTSAHSIIVV